MIPSEELTSNELIGEEPSLPIMASTETNCEEEDIFHLKSCPSYEEVIKIFGSFDL